MCLIGDRVPGCVQMPSPHVLRQHLKGLSIVPHVGPVLVPAQRHAHVEGVLAVVVVVLDLAVDAVAHLPVQLLGHGVALAHEQVDKPGILRVAGLGQRVGEGGRVAQAARAWRDGEGGDVAVPGQVVWIWVGVRGVGVHLGREGRRFELAEDWEAGGAC